MSDLITTLHHIEKHPGMYFGDGERSRSICVLQAFILGFEAGQQASDARREFDCFTQWVATHYPVLADGMGSDDIILEHVGGDERKAFDEFFRLLPEYLRDRQRMGWDGIQSRFSEVQDECMKAFKKELENQ